MISKPQDFPDSDDPESLRYYFNGPRFVEFMREIRQILDRYNCFTVGEMPGTLPLHGEAYTHEETGVCNMLFHFELMEVDAEGTKWNHKPWKLADIKKIMSIWQTTMDKGWNTLYCSNHDQPRPVSRFGDDGQYRELSATMLATWLHMMKGTPFIYQGNWLQENDIVRRGNRYDQCEVRLH